MMRTGFMWAAVLTAALSAAYAADKGKVEAGRLTGTWVCKSLAEDGQTVVASELRFSGALMTWVHPDFVAIKRGTDPGRLEAGFGVSQDGRLFGVVTQVHRVRGPADGDPFSLKMSLDGDELTLTELRAPDAKEWPAIKGVYRKKP